MAQAVALVVVALLLAVATARLWAGQDYLEAVASGVGALTTLLTLVPKVSPGAYLALRRIHALVTFATVSWTVNVVATGELDDRFLDRLDESIVPRGGTARNITARPHYRYYEVPRLSSIEVTITAFAEPGLHQLDARIIAPGVKYSDARALFEEQALGVVRALEDAGRNDAGVSAFRDESFHLTVDYARGGNPFYGMFLHWMGYGEVTSFRVAIRLDERTTLIVQKESASLTSADPVRFGRAAADLIGLSGRALQPARPPA